MPTPCAEPLRAEVVVNLVGIPANAGPQTFEGVHVVGAGVVATAAREAGAKRLVHISAICAQHTRAGEYARSKGEAVVLDQFPGAIVLRPSLVFGPEDQLFNRFAAIARLSPFLPLIAAGAHACNQSTLATSRRRLRRQVPGERSRARPTSWVGHTFAPPASCSQ